MKIKNLALSAIICGASIFGLNLPNAQAAADFGITNIEQNTEIEQLSQKVRDRNRAIAAALGIAAIVSAVDNDYYDDDYYYHRRHGYGYPPPYHYGRGQYRHYPPPPPPPMAPYPHRYHR